MNRVVASNVADNFAQCRQMVSETVFAKDQMLSDFQVGLEEEGNLT